MRSPKVITAPEPIDLAPHDHALFLAGSIEQGAAIDWQSVVIDALADVPLTVLNPRRAQWDSTWPQSASDPRFREQVQWELTALERANTIALYLDPNTKAPVSLLELGLFARSSKLIVCCPDGFWRKGNVDIVCERYAIETAATIDALVARARARAFTTA
ncbi:MAG: nucleoside 2-deoxyribosyltransferase domain-containing protein [Polyangiales bacterium]